MHFKAFHWVAVRFSRIAWGFGSFQASFEGFLERFQGISGDFDERFEVFS